MSLSVYVKLLGRCLTVCLHWWPASEALLLLIHVARRSYIAFAYPPSCSGACFLVYRFHALHAGTAVVIAYLCCRRDRMGLPNGTHASFHVNVYALITPPPWSILSLFQPPLQRSPSVVTLASTYCSFPVCGDRQEFRESPFVGPERASLSFVFQLYLPPLRRAARPRSESSVGDPVIICLLFHLPNLWRAAQAGQLIIAFLRNLLPLWRAARPRSERSVGGPVITRLLFHLPTFMARGPSGPAFHSLSARLWRAVRTGQLIIAFLCNLPRLLRAARPRSERSVGSPVIICLLFHLPTFMASGPSGPAFHCLSAQVSLVMACGPSGPAFHCLLRHLPPLRVTRPVLGASAP